MRKITLQLASHKSQRAINAMQMHSFDWFIHSGVILACIELPQNSGFQTLEKVYHVFKQFIQIKIPCQVLLICQKRNWSLFAPSGINVVEK